MKRKDIKELQNYEKVMVSYDAIPYDPQAEYVFITSLRCTQNTVKHFSAVNFFFAKSSILDDSLGYKDAPVRTER